MIITLLLSVWPNKFKQFNPLKQTWNCFI